MHDNSSFWQSTRPSQNFDIGIQAPLEQGSLFTGHFFVQFWLSCSSDGSRRLNFPIKPQSNTWSHCHCFGIHFFEYLQWKKLSLSHWFWTIGLKLQFSAFSSLESTQSGVKSHFHSKGMHNPLDLHENSNSEQVGLADAIDDVSANKKSKDQQNVSSYLHVLN